MGGELTCRMQRSFAIVSRTRLMTGHLEEQRHAIRRVLVVVDDEQAQGRRWLNLSGHEFRRRSARRIKTLGLSGHANGTNSAAKPTVSPAAPSTRRSVSCEGDGDGDAVAAFGEDRRNSSAAIANWTTEKPSK